MYVNESIEVLDETAWWGLTTKVTERRQNETLKENGSKFQRSYK